jgi:hypothetical protein
MSATLQSLCDAVSGPNLMAHCVEFARWVKLSGSEDELKSLRIVQARLDDYGYRTRLLMHDAYISLPGRAGVTVDATELAAITHSYSRSSPRGGVTGRVVYVGEGSQADFAGKDVRNCIVLAEGIANPAVAHLALRGGAVGQLHISPHEYLHEMCISPVWGNPSPATLGDIPGTVCCTVSHADGTKLRDRIAAGEAPRVVLTAEVDTGWRKTPILVGEMDAPGGAEDAPFILLSGHHDTWYFGVMDNGSADATILETARLAASGREAWKRGLRICFWSGHSHGRYSGSTWYADQHWDELERRCAAHVNVDSTGGIGASVLRNAKSAAELVPLAAEAIGRQAGSDILGARKNRSSDDSFPGVGIPSMFGSLSEQAPGPVKMRNSLGWWWHTAHDMLDKIDEANLVRDTKVYVHVVWRLLSDAVLPIDYAVHANALQGELGKIAASLGGRFDIAALVAGATALRDHAAVVKAKAENASGMEAARMSAAIMRAGRAMVPMDYTTGDRFAHDFALPLPNWPTLEPIRDLAATAAGSDAARFAEVAATRARNRVAFALRQANAALVAVLQVES